MLKVYVPFSLAKRGKVTLPSSNSSDSWMGHLFANFADKGLCVSTESSDLLAKSPVGMTD